MKDNFMMWKKHNKDPEKYFRLLKKITDDNRDGFPEVNCPEGVKALLASVRVNLESSGVPLDAKTTVFVDGDLYTTYGINWTSIPKKPHRYSPYGSVFKFDHGICSAKNALGAKGCAESHSVTSDFFFKKIMVRRFGKDGKPITQMNAPFLGYSAASLQFAVFEHETLKSLGYWAIFVVAVLLMFHYVIYGPKRVELYDPSKTISTISRFGTWERVLHYSLLVLFLIQAATGLFTFAVPRVSSDVIGWFYSFHHYVGYLFLINTVLVFGIWVRDAFFEKYDRDWLRKPGGYLGYREELPAGRSDARQKLYLWLTFMLSVFFGIAGTTKIFSGNGA